MLPNHARYQLRYISIGYFYSNFVSGQDCGQALNFSNFPSGEEFKKVSAHKALRRFEILENQNRSHAPKPCALPTALHLDSKLNFEWEVIKKSA